MNRTTAQTRLAAARHAEALGTDWCYGVGFASGASLPMPSEIDGHRPRRR